MADGPFRRQVISRVDGQRALRHLDEDATALDEHVVHRERLVGGRIEDVARRQVEAGEVERARDRPGGQEALVELEVLVAADALVGAEPTIHMDDQHGLRTIDPGHLHRAFRDLVEPQEVEMSHAEQAGPAPETHAEADDLCDEPARSSSAAPSLTNDVSRANPPSGASWALG